MTLITLIKIARSKRGKPAIVGTILGRAFMMRIIFAATCYQ